MNIYVEGYSKQNLGDDLFFKILFERYKNKDNLFYIIYNRKNKTLKQYENVKVLHNYLELFFNRIMKKSIFYFRRNLYKQVDLAIKIGGSLFMGNNMDEKSLYLYKVIKNYYIIGSNFGPYKTQKYYETYYEIFSKAQDICFRDKYTYDLFKNLHNCRIASDIVFSLDTDYLNLHNDKKVIISVINCDKKGLNQYKDVYNEKIIDFIYFFAKLNYKVVLMSYCKTEGDENTIKKIIKRLDKNLIKNNIEVYKYRGNIEEALNVMSNCQIVIGSRFHANILGLLLNKTIIPIAYSDKTINVLNDMNFKGKILDVRKLSTFQVDTITDYDLKYKLNVDFQKNDARRNFEKLDEVLKNR